MSRKTEKVILTETNMNPGDGFIYNIKKLLMKTRKDVSPNGPMSITVDTIHAKYQDKDTIITHIEATDIYGETAVVNPKGKTYTWYADLNEPNYEVELAFRDEPPLNFAMTLIVCYTVRSRK